MYKCKFGSNLISVYFYLNKDVYLKTILLNEIGWYLVFIQSVP
jgi:hypothetical protein